jgi:hypothetical protein
VDQDDSKVVVVEKMAVSKEITDFNVEPKNWNIGQNYWQHISGGKQK